MRFCVFFGRILALARHKTSKTVWATTPWWVAEDRASVSSSSSYLSEWKQTRHPQWLLLTLRLLSRTNQVAAVTSHYYSGMFLHRSPDSRRVCGQCFLLPSSKLDNQTQTSGTLKKQKYKKTLEWGGGEKHKVNRGLRWLKASLILSLLLDGLAFGSSILTSSILKPFRSVVPRIKNISASW